MSIARYLFLDDRSIKSSSNVSLKLGRVCKHPKNPLMIEDQTWEQRYDNFYGNIIYDQAEELFKCWYSPFIVANSSIGMSYDCLLYTSPSPRDGLLSRMPSSA